MAQSFRFSPAPFIPFRDCKAIKKVLKIKKAAMTRHANKHYRIRVLPDGDIGWMWVADMVARIKEAGEAGRPVVMITPNPCRIYIQVARLLNRLQIDCKHLHTFNMDEYANEKGEIAPESWPFGFMHAFKKYFYTELDPKLRPAENQIHGPTTKNITSYSRMIEDQGGADICYSGPGWTGHLAFIEPDAPEFKAKDLKAWMNMEARVCRLSPFTLAQNSLHGSFGQSGNLTAVPPYAATIGPIDVVRAQHRIDIHSLRIDDSQASWQRLITRLCLHGPVTPLVPTSMLQLLNTDVWVSESSAEDIGPRWHKEY